jgi:hypothetical protein
MRRNGIKFSLLVGLVHRIGHHAGVTGADDSLLRRFDNEALGLISCADYTVDLKTEGNERFTAGKYQRGGSRIVSGPCDATDLHSWPSRFATDDLARRDGIRLPGRTFADWLAQW